MTSHNANITESLGLLLLLYFKRPVIKRPFTSGGFMSGSIYNVKHLPRAQNRLLYPERPQHLYLGSILYQCRLVLSFHTFISQNFTMDYPQGEGVWIPMSGDIQTKRKALENLVNQRQPHNLEGRFGGCQDTLRTDLEVEGDLPQKKQKLGSNPCSCSKNVSCLACDDSYIPYFTPY